MQATEICMCTCTLDSNTARHKLAAKRATSEPFCELFEPKVCATPHPSTRILRLIDSSTLPLPQPSRHHPDYVSGSAITNARKARGWRPNPHQTYLVSKYPIMRYPVTRNSEDKISSITKYPIARCRIARNFKDKFSQIQRTRSRAPDQGARSQSSPRLNLNYISLDDYQMPDLKISQCIL
jgi:hypothetical protein